MELKGRDENLYSNAQHLERIVVDFYTNLFSSNGVLDVDTVIRSVQPWVTDTTTNTLCQPYNPGEVYQAFLQMHPGKAPGPNGLNPFFYQKFWPTVGADITQTVLNILHGGDIPPYLNHTHIVLIPKKHHQNDINDFRLISLCNILYQLAMKVIANRLKTCLPGIISVNQSAFVPGRMITNGILIAFEIFHDMTSRPRSNGGMALKLDMAKAFEEWNGISYGL